MFSDTRSSANRFDLFNRVRQFFGCSLNSVCYLFLSIPVTGFASSIDLFSLSPEELSRLPVQSITSFETSLSRSPNNVKVLTAEDIDNLPATTLADLIQLYVPGARSASQGFVGHFFSVRGISRSGGPKTLTMWDGHSLNQRTNWGNASVFSSQLLGDLDQIEVVLGPGSLVHGTGALNGYINFVPKTGEDHPGFGSRLDLGPTDRLAKFQADFGKRYGDDRHYFLYAGVMEADGLKFDNDFGGMDSSLRPVRRAFANSSSDNVLEYRPSYKISGNWRHDQFSFTAFYEYLEYDPNTPLVQRERYDQKSVLSLQPRYNFKLNDTDFLEISPSFTWFDKSRIFESRTSNFEDDKRGGSERFTELKATYQTERFSNQKIALGLSYSWRNVTSLRNYFSSDPTLNTTHVDGKWQEYSVFLEDQIQINKRASLTLGLREDRTRFKKFRSEIDQFPNITFTPDDVSQLIPRAALTYELNDQHLVRLSYQEGFRYPDVSQYPRTEAVSIVLEDFGFAPLRSLQPESVESIELGINSHWFARKLHSQLTLYHNRYKDFVGFRNLRVGAPLAPPEVIDAIPRNVFGLEINNSDDFQSIGGELTLNWAPSPRFRGTVAYAYSIPDDVSVQSNINLAIANESRSEWSVFPKHQIKAGIEYRKHKWLSALSALYESAVDTDETVGSREIFSESHIRVNAMLQYRIRNNLTAFAIGKNIFGNNTPPLNTTTSRPWNGNLGSDERLFYFGLKWSL